MRPVLFLTSVLLLACSGILPGQDPKPPIVPVAPPPPIVPAQDPATEPATESPGTDGEIYGEVGVWEPVDGTCAWNVRDTHTGQLRQTLASLPGSCPSHRLESWHPDGKRLLLSLGDAIAQVRLPESDGPGLTEILPPLPAEGTERPSVDGAGYGEDGTPIALGSVPAELHRDDEQEAAWFERGGERIEVSWGDLDYAAGVDLCVAWKLDAGTWVEQAHAVSLSGEGTAPPFCNLPDLGVTSEIADPRESAAHTSSFSTALEPDSLPPEMRAEGERWGALDLDGGHRLACQVEWLEGELYFTPVRFEVEGQWRPLEGMSGNGTLSWSSDDATLIACAGEGVNGVYDLATGKLKWRPGGCPQFWDRGSRG